MIYLGRRKNEKNDIIKKYCEKNKIDKIFILSNEKFYFDSEYEFIEWKNIIQYTIYYRLLKEIKKDSLLILNECLRTKNRYDLTYNCIRHFLNQTEHQIIFQYLPIIDNREDFMILFDFDTRSKWKRENFNSILFKNSIIDYKKIDIILKKIDIKTNEKIKNDYNKKKKELFSREINDPDMIPRNLYLVSGKCKYDFIKNNNIDNLFCDNIFKDYWFIGRNNRFKLNNFQKYRKEEYDKKYIIFELCHNFINFIDFIFLSEQKEFEIFISDLKIDSWYWNRYLEWVKEIEYVYSIL